MAAVISTISLIPIPAVLRTLIAVPPTKTSPSNIAPTPCIARDITLEAIEVSFIASAMRCNEGSNAIMS